MKIIFFVYIPGRKQFTGGHVVMHKLLKIIDNLGYEVWSNQIPLFECNCRVIENLEELRNIENEKIVTIYPEQIEGNPINAKNVCRWILYHTKIEVENTWNESDHIFKYCDGFNIITKKDYRILNIVDGKLQVFKNHGKGSLRKGYCHINKKKYPKDEKILSSLNSKNLSDFSEHGGFEFLSNEFNQYEYFLTYDDATYYSVLAALCGCRSIIINPDNRISPDEYRIKFPINKYGVAYGFQDIKHADLTRDLTRPYIESLENNSTTSVIDFIKYWESELSI